MFDFFRKKDEAEILAEKYRVFQRIVERYFVEKGKFPLFIEGKTFHIEGEPGVFSLENLWEQCLIAKESQWSQLVKLHFDQFLKAQQEIQELKTNIQTLGDAQDKLGIRLYPLKYFADSESLDDVVYWRHFDGIISVLVLDLPTIIVTLSPKEIEQWNVSKEQIFEAALLNTFRKSRPAKVTVPLPNGETIISIEDDTPFSPTNAYRIHQYKELVGDYGTLFSIPTSTGVLAYPVKDASILKMLNTFIPTTFNLFQQGPGAISSQIYWQFNDQMITLPYAYEDGQFNFFPPDRFVAVLEEMNLAAEIE
ncbi:MAG: hypothetical protein QY314_02540 [Candidatus Dojkabacteria bacterium]|nr:MAG: hypothetical protein QY314_02540 [Candidatus Dojkabacteria bacterium]